MRRFLSGLAAAGVGLFYGTVTTASALAAVTTLYVGGTNCSDTGQGTATQPYCTIVKAADLAAAGQTVLVSSGTYSGPIAVQNSGTAGNSIVFQPAAGASVTVQGGLYGFSLSNRSYVTVSGFAITGTVKNGIFVSGSNNITIADNKVTLSGTPAIGKIAPGIGLYNTSASTVTGNIADQNSDTGIYLASGTTGTTVSHNEASLNANGYQRNANGINVIGPSNSIIANLLHDNEDSGLQIYTGGDNSLAALNVSYNNGDHGIDDLNVSGGRLIGNTIYHNCTSGINVEGTSGNYLVTNNIAVDNAVYPAYKGISCNRRAGNIGIWDSAPSSTTVDSNLVYLSKPGPMYVFGTSFASLAAMRAATGKEQHGLQADPGFANAAAGGLTLTAGSPAIDSADASASGEQTTDARGSARVDDPGVTNTGLGPRSFDDRGAYEFAGGTPANTPPTARVSVSPLSGAAPVAVTADGSGSSDPQGQALSYRFDFGDGTVVGPQAGAVAAHTYSLAGSHTVRLTVTDTGGLSGAATATVTVSAPVNTPPTARVSVSPLSGAAPVAVTADGSGSSDPQGQALSYRFDFGDGTVVGPQAGAAAAHTYSLAGSHTVTLTVTDTGGLSGTATATVTVSAGGGGATISYVNQIATNLSTSTHTSGSVTVWRAGGVTAGDLTVVTVALTGTSSGTVTGTDDAGDPLAVASDIIDGSGHRLIVLSGIVRTGLAVNQKISVTFPSAATYRITADEVSGATVADRHVEASGSGTSFSSGATGVTAATREFVFSAVGLFAGSAPTWGAGWKPLTVYAINTDNVGRSYQISSATGSFTGSGTGSGTWLAATVTFR